MENKLDLFICTHKEFNNPTTSNIYKILGLGKDCKLPYNNVFYDNTGDNISYLNSYYCELTGYYWIWKNYKLKDYIGFCHYRRYWEFLNNFNIIKEYLIDYDIIVPHPYKQNTYEQYKSAHNIEDLDLVIDILKNDYNITDNIINEFKISESFYSTNMFITSKELFCEYCEFLFSILDKFNNIKHINNIDDVYNIIKLNKTKYIKGFYPINDIKYQSRFAGYLSERIFNIWLKIKKLRIKEVNVIVK